MGISITIYVISQQGGVNIMLSKFLIGWNLGTGLSNEFSCGHWSDCEVS